jgi:type I restriction enzyme R subunit
MFLTGFDAPTLNTLFVDKNLRYHGLMQAYSRTNRIFDATKTFGNIVTFRDLEQATIDAITLFGDKNTKNVVLEKSYKEYMEGFTDVATGEARRGFVDVVRSWKQRFPDPAAIEKESDKKAFCEAVRRVSARRERAAELRRIRQPEGLAKRRHERPCGS